MQPISEGARRLLFHGALLAVLLALFLATSHSLQATERAADRDSSATGASAFSIHSRRHLPPLGDRRIRSRVATLFAGIPQRGTALGNPKAPVTMQFLADPECPEARQFAVQLLPLLVRRWVRNGRLRIEYRGEREETVTALLFEHQQMAVLAAGRQGKLWQYLELFYHYQGPEFTRYADRRFLRGIAEEIKGLSLADWARERSDPQLVRQIELDEKLRLARDLRYTPAFLIGPTGGALEPLLHFTLNEPLAFEGAFRSARRS